MKQSRLNGLHVVIGLHTDQIAPAAHGLSHKEAEEKEGAEEEKDDNDDDDPLLVFSDTEWKRLRTRTEELKAERARHKSKFK